MSHDDECIAGCGCGAVWTQATWDALPLVGHMPAAQPGMQLELRNCTECHSTRAIVLDDGSTADTLPAPAMPDADADAWLHILLGNELIREMAS